MLPERHRQAIAQLQQTLEHLQNQLTEANLDKVTLTAAFRQAQQLLENILQLGDGDVSPSLVSPLQSYLTEIHKQMRLLEMDFRFLQTSRQTATLQTRQTQMRSRVATLIGYCKSLLDK
ncbi:heterocyst frequency control protein PatD [Capilliphycus salinus ALCB114379]|uniref:heterocyst frequency control protein PatD n=1 Tax=Capilliphycus salinus TaxID=2768948 RepID=UPI0039A5B212